MSGAESPQPPSHRPSPIPSEARSASVLLALGPGVLFAGAAIGVSHLVQSTRAGALYALSLVPLIVLVHVLKLPALLAGPRYAAATGASLIEGYRRQGRHALVLFALIALGTMFTIQAAVTVVAAAVVDIALLEGVLGLNHRPSVFVTALALMTLAAGVTAAGGFRWLQRVMKALMLVLLLTTLAAAGVLLPRLDPGAAFAWPALTTAAHIGFIIALIGWMPAPLDIAVWHSLWTLARTREVGSAPTLNACRGEFLVGYLLCVVLAVCFVLLGAVVVHQNGVTPAQGSGPFVAQLLGLYGEAFPSGLLGLSADAVVSVVGVCAVATMLSTTFSVQDALPRTAVAVVRAVTTNSKRQTGDEPREPARSVWFWLAMLLVVGGATPIIAMALSESEAGQDRFLRLIDLATAVSFLGTPVLAWLNHRASLAPEVPPEFRPGTLSRRLSLAAIGFFTLFAIGYLASLILA